jgi:hypothetical protein
MTLKIQTTPTTQLAAVSALPGAQDQTGGEGHIVLGRLCPTLKRSRCGAALTAASTGRGESTPIASATQHKASD